MTSQVTKHTITRVWRCAAPLVVWPAVALLPHPAALSQNAWSYLGLFTAVIVALVLEPIPPAAVGLLGMTLATAFGSVSPRPDESIKWGLERFLGSHRLAHRRRGLSLRERIREDRARKIALPCRWSGRCGKRTLGLGYAVMLADLLIAPFTPSNTGRSAGVIFPIIRGIPALYDSARLQPLAGSGAYLDVDSVRLDRRH